MSNAQKPIHPVVIVERLHTGLTKREYFAGLAMQALSANYHAPNYESRQICENAVKYADELLKQLEK